MGGGTRDDKESEYGRWRRMKSREEGCQKMPPERQPGVEPERVGEKNQTILQSPPYVSKGNTYSETHTEKSWLSC